jgi:hypothetical protein
VKRKNTGRCGNTSGQECHSKEEENEVKIQHYMYGDAMNVEHEILNMPVVIETIGIVTRS